MPVTKNRGRFGAKYGQSIRKLITEMGEKKKRTYICPVCKRKSLVRESSGVWICTKCGIKIAGDAYTPNLKVVENV